ncbi:MAG: GHMP kinase [Planctomycetaceae bacterium]|jgi:glucuronokinase|nr:GHMP kinase [Planctomycetaceae bacterium]MBT4723778.1 GHMP kinase [Planctomycetaceae bacterium]MBT4846903.1 GHMP kinase [Planctomycetaceae bacterium]MBT5883589.1 GHMP kinase [Planctomycetaceae bacterium]MBT7917515.1 GHMP kinase [Planctomycetaceae bacterium]
MQTLHHNAHARAGLLGNPSDGYHGKTISVSVPAFAATVTLYEWETLEIIASREDRSRFGSVLELAQDVELHGYYGGIRLVKATIKKFVEFCNGKHTLHDRNFSIRYNSDIPRAVGLAGSSAIIVATLRALMNFYEVGIPLEVQPSLVLSVEKDELSIQGGLQDRVIQVYDGLVYMDFSEQASTNQQGLCCGTYERLSTKNLPPLFLAYDATVGEPTEVFHNRLRERFAQGESKVVNAMTRFAEIAAEGRGVIQENNWARLNELIDENFDLRNSICQLPTAQVDMITRARKVGASAKFAGSGGAIIGIYQDDSMFDQLQLTLNQIGCDILKV